MATTVRSFRVVAPFEDLINKLSGKSEFSNVYVKVFRDSKVAVLCGEEFFLRTRSWTGITIVVRETAPNTCVVDAIGFAGVQGILKISWFSEESYIDYFEEFLRKHYQVEVL